MDCRGGVVAVGSQGLGVSSCVGPTFRGTRASSSWCWGGDDGRGSSGTLRSQDGSPVPPPFQTSDYEEEGTFDDGRKWRYGEEMDGYPLLGNDTTCVL